MVDVILKGLSTLFESLYSKSGRPSIAPEKLLRILLLQVLYSVRSEQLLMEQLDYNLLYLRFVGLSTDDPVWDATVFSRNRDRVRYLSPDGVMIDRSYFKPWQVKYVNTKGAIC